MNEPYDHLIENLYLTLISTQEYHKQLEKIAFDYFEGRYNFLVSFNKIRKLCNKTDENCPWDLSAYIKLAKRILPDFIEAYRETGKEFASTIALDSLGINPVRPAAHEKIHCEVKDNPGFCEQWRKQSILPSGLIKITPCERKYVYDIEPAIPTINENGHSASVNIKELEARVASQLLTQQKLNLERAKALLEKHKADIAPYTAKLTSWQHELYPHQKDLMHYLATLNQQKDKTMSDSKALLETRHFHRGRDVADMTDNELIGTIKTIEQDLEKLKTVKTKSTKIEAKIKEMEKALTDIAVLLDTRAAK